MLGPVQAEIAKVVDAHMGQKCLRIYTTGEVHTSVDRAVWVAGIGDDNLVRLPTSGATKAMDVNALQSAIAADRAAGMLPCGIISSLGGTSMGGCDDVAAIARVADAEGLYLHVDAAWAGNAMLCPELRPLWAGTERADSIVFNPYKWMGGQFEGSVHFVQAPEDLTRTLAYQPEFLDAAWTQYLSENNVSEDKVDPDAFIRWTYARALAHRKPRYQAMRPWGISIGADQVAAVRNAEGFDDMIATALDAA